MRILFILPLLFVLFGCGPVYETTYRFDAPHSVEGKYCANDCLADKQICYESCQRAVAECEQAANIAHLSNQVGKILANQKDATAGSSTANTSHCKERAKTCQRQCNENHRLCHRNCGGNVHESTQCVRNCEK